jgi:glutathione S-transferase
MAPGGSVGDIFSAAVQVGHDGDFPSQPVGAKDIRAVEPLGVFCQPGARAMTDLIALSGAPGSPYTRKMLGVLRYRRIAYRLLPPSGPALAGLPQPKVPLLPTFYLPDEAGELQAVTDSTPIIRRLEREHAGRSLIPTDPALAFLDELIEDYADEWLTKAMFHYRWSYAPDIAKGAALLPCWRGFTVPDEELRIRGAFVAERQIGRLRYVGSNEVTGPVIEASYRRFLAAFEAHLTHLPYLLGHRPAASDWVSMAALPDTLVAILAEIGRVYPPVMLANAEAVMARAPEVTARVDGEVWTQQPFPYQAKCLGWLRQSRDNLPPEARAQIDAVLAPAGLAGLFA